MLKNENVLLNSLYSVLERVYGKEYRVSIQLNSFVKQDGAINRLYVNITATKIKNKKRDSGKIGYFDLNEKTFISEGRIYSAVITMELQEICQKFEIEVEQEEVQKELNKEEIKKEVSAMFKQLEGMQKELENLTNKLTEGLKMIEKIKRKETDEEKELKSKIQAFQVQIQEKQKELK